MLQYVLITSVYNRYNWLLPPWLKLEEIELHYPRSSLLETVTSIEVN